MLVSEDVYNKTPEKTNTGNHNDQVTCRIMIFFYLYYFSIKINHTFFYLLLILVADGCTLMLTHMNCALRTHSIFLTISKSFSSQHRTTCINLYFTMNSHDIYYIYFYVLWILDSRLNKTFILVWWNDIIKLRRAPATVMIRLTKVWWFCAFKESSNRYTSIWLFLQEVCDHVWKFFCYA